MYNAHIWSFDKHIICVPMREIKCTMFLEILYTTVSITKARNTLFWSNTIDDSTFSSLFQSYLITQVYQDAYHRSINILAGAETCGKSSLLSLRNDYFFGRNRNKV